MERIKLSVFGVGQKPKQKQLQLLDHPFILGRGGLNAANNHAAIRYQGPN